MVGLLTSARLTAVAALGSAALLAGAYVFQLLGYAPCQMCIWQRYPHGVAFGIGLAIFLIGQKWMMLLGALAAASTSAIGAFHVGVEQGWWQGPTSCSSGSIDDLSPDALLDQIMTAPLVRCDEIPWELLGISMAGWNSVLSLALVALWLTAWRRA